MMKFLALPFVIAGLLLVAAPAAASSVPPATRVSGAGHPNLRARASKDLVAAPAAGAIAAHGPRPAVGSVVTNALQREVFGFALASSLSDPTFGYPSWNFALLSTVAFFGLHINDDGTIAADQAWTVWNSSQLTNLLGAAHAEGAKVVLTVIEQDFSPGTPHMCAALASRATAVSQTVAQVSAKGVDGVNLDFEGLNGTCPNGQSAQSMMTDLAHQVRSALPSGSYLSIDTYASSASDPLGFFDIAGLSGYVDSFFVMAYDLEYSNYARPPTNCGSFCLGPTAPLGSYYYNDTTTAAQYTAVVPATKVILGVPYYGRKACVASATPNAYPTGVVTADTYLDASNEASAAQVQAGSYATHRDANDPSGQERWDTWYNTSLGCTRELYWDDTVSLGAKYDLVNQDGLRGVGIWNLNYGGGAPELWSALQSHFVGCRAVALSANPASPQFPQTSVTFTASTGGCPDPNPLYQFWTLAAGASSWQVAQPYSTTVTFTWNTAGLAIGTYRVAVWARDANSNGIYGNIFGRWDVFNAIDYTLVAPTCTGLSAMPAPLSPSVVGTPVTITGTAFTCPTPRYQFELLAPGSSSWQVAQGYSSSNHITWDTSSLAAGTYTFIVKARDATSAGVSGSNANGSWDVYVVVSYSITYGAPCASVTAMAAPASPQPAGTPETISGSAAGCANPRYQFEVLAPGAPSWVVAQAYSSSANFNWTTTGQAAGDYKFIVKTRDKASSGPVGVGNPNGSWDAYATLTFHLSSTPCTSISVTASPNGTAAQGTTVNITITSSGCPNPRYQAEILAPGSSSWQVAQVYGPSNVFSWNTTGATKGTYKIIVKVRDAASPGAAGSGNPNGSWDQYALISYTIT